MRIFSYEIFSYDIVVTKEEQQKAAISFFPIYLIFKLKFH